MNCSLCHGTRSTLISRTDCKSGKPLDIHLCGRCGLIQQHPLPSAADLQRYYASEYRMDYKRTWQPKPKHVHRSARLAIRRAAFLRAGGIHSGSLLDIGAGSGEFVTICRRLGFQARGAEPNIGYSGYAREEYGAEVITRELADLEGTHDIITLFHVMEHLPSPRDVFARLHGLLKPGGKLLVEVPWGLSPAISPSNRYFKAHLYYFEMETLAACASPHFSVLSHSQAGNLSVLFQRKDPPHHDIQLPPPAYPAHAGQRALRLGWWTYLTTGGGLRKPIHRFRRIHEEHHIRHLSGSSIVNRLLREAAL